MQFAPIAYEDMSLLNAQWQQARPAVHGLGMFPDHVDAEYVERSCADGRCMEPGVAHYGQHEYRDLSYLNARLRPIFPAEVGMPPPSTAAPGWGDGSLSGNSLGVVTLEETHIVGDPNASPFGGSGGTNWMLWGGAVAAIAVGGALIYKASKKRR